MKAATAKALLDAIAKGTAKLNQTLKEMRAKGKAPDPHGARMEHPGFENLKNASAEIVRKTTQAAARAVKSVEMDR
jgi:hypothetical protein